MATKVTVGAVVAGGVALIAIAWTLGGRTVNVPLDGPRFLDEEVAKAEVKKLIPQGPWRLCRFVAVSHAPGTAAVAMAVSEFQKGVQRAIGMAVQFSDEVGRENNFSAKSLEVHLAKVRQLQETLRMLHQGRAAEVMASLPEGQHVLQMILIYLQHIEDNVVTTILGMFKQMPTGHKWDSQRTGTWNKGVENMLTGPLFRAVVLLRDKWLPLAADKAGEMAEALKGDWGCNYHQVIQDRDCVLPT